MGDHLLITGAVSKSFVLDYAKVRKQKNLNALHGVIVNELD